MNKITSSNTFVNLKTFARSHKIITGLVVLTLFVGGYKSLKAKGTTGETHYVLGTVSRGTLSVSVSGTGQVSASSQIDVKAKAAGDILAVNVHTGDEVAAGAVLASIDASDALNALKSAQLSYAKLVEPADQSSVISAQAALTDAQTAETKAYTASVSDLTSTFGDFPTIISGMNDLLYTTSGYLSDQSVSALGPSASAFRTTAGSEFDTANREYTNLISEYKSINLSSSHEAIEQVLIDSTKASADLAQALKDAQTAVNYVKDAAANNQSSSKLSTTAATDAQSDLSTWINQMSGHVSALTTDKSSIDSAPQTIAERQASLDKINQGVDPLDLQSEQLSLQQKQEAYNDAFVRAPISGVVGKIDVKVGDSASSGTVIATIVSKEKMATVSLNEVDAAKVHTGDKAILTFDAVDGLSVTGTVTDVDLIGTVTQGVVTYNAKITFDQDDTRVLSGMSVNASIITDVKTDVLTVPASAVKSDSQGSYVLAFTPALTATGGTQGVVSAVAPEPIAVETGLTNDTSVEITSGLTEDEQIVTRVVTPTTTTATAQAPSLLGGGAARTGGTAATRSFAR